MLQRQSKRNGADTMQHPTTSGQSRSVGIGAVLVFAALVAAGAGLRLVFRDIPNFAPVVALALFAGYYFRSAVVAICVPLAVMAISDWFLGGYGWTMMALVYGMLAFPVLLRGWLRRTFRFDRPGIVGSFTPAAGLIGCSLLSSVLFFVVTNFGVWLWFGAYEPSFAGLVHCYAAAIPFFRHTLAGDLAFSVVLFGSYAAAHAYGMSRQLVADAT